MGRQRVRQLATGQELPAALYLLSDKLHPNNPLFPPVNDSGGHGNCEKKCFFLRGGQQQKHSFRQQTKDSRSLRLVPGAGLTLTLAQSCPTLRPHGLWPARLLSPWDSPGKNPGVGCHFLLQLIFPTQGPNPGLLHWQVDSLPLSHLASLFWMLVTVLLLNCQGS